jgi:hypothetical protein
MTDEQIKNQNSNKVGHPEKEIDLDVIAKAIRDTFGSKFTCENAADIFGCCTSTIERKLIEKFGPHMTWGRFKSWHRKVEAESIIRRAKDKSKTSDQILAKLLDVAMDEAAENKKPEIEINIVNKYLSVPEERLIQLLQTAQQAIQQKIETKTLELTKGNDYDRTDAEPTTEPATETGNADHD